MRTLDIRKICYHDGNKNNFFIPNGNSQKPGISPTIKSINQSIEKNIPTGNMMIKENVMFINNPIAVLDKNAKIKWVNDEFAKLSGYPFEEYLNKSWQLIRQNENFHKTVIKEKQRFSCEYKNYSFKKNIYWTLANITPVLNVNGELENILVVETDITRMKEREEELITASKIAEHSLKKGNKAIDKLRKTKDELEKSVKIKERFFAHMSHEIRTPMSGIIGLTDLLLKANPTDEQKEYLTAMKLSGDALLVVINQILDFSKIDAGKMQLKEEPFHLRESINTVINIFSIKAMEKNIDLKKRIDHWVPDILKGDAYRLNQILMNLVSNAIKFTSQGEVMLALTVKAETEETVTIEFLFSDTGCGIPDNKTPYLFCEFYQAHQSPYKYEGTGLGLSISKKLIELQGGTITVQSRLGEGTMFVVTLPFKKCNGSDQNSLKQKLEEDKKFVTTKELAGLRVLLVEDTPVNQLLGEKLLSDMEMVIDVAENGKIAVEKLKENFYDLVLMDIKMPEMDGYEATRFVRTMMDPAIRNVPIIALTAYTSSAEAFKCLKMGMNDYVTKPFNAKDLYNKIKEVMKKNKIAIHLN